MSTDSSTFSRRKLLTRSVGALGVLAGSGSIAQALAGACGLTPPQTEGPFYPEDQQLDTDTDLTRVKGKSGKALGDVIYIQGTVQDGACAPVAGALVEIWQACESGRYNHSADPNSAPLDPNFQYWGKAVTDAEGKYLFKTILPGAYPAEPGWDRPPHIHYKVSRMGYHELITQLYFGGQSLNSKDHILNAIPAAERIRVITELAPAGAGFEPGSQIGKFDITLRKVR